ncbi:MAG: glutamine--fructose-6-phosphate transaminase (isomerizing) [Planctomycetes bacterium]|nr:glutamine--fructose-6-phosphate transaminase (isomerizing) [Planctomycetota bacterium]
MCGIVGYVGPRAALPVLVEGLRRLEYRGYDSAGVVVLNGHGLESEKSPGKLQNLEERLKKRPLDGTIGLGHTRWATHGGATEPNAHPHFSCDRRIALVHNGIVENFAELKRGLRGHRFASETDTEVAAHLIERFYASERDPVRAVHRAVGLLRGHFAFAVIFADHPDLLVAARLNCPLVLGLGEEENFIASDIAALLPYTRRALPLDEGDIARVDRAGVRVFDRMLVPARRPVIEVTWGAESAAKGGHAHYMLKEILQQSETVAAELSGRVDAERGDVRFERFGIPKAALRSARRIAIAACGTAWHAGLVAKCAIEELAKVPADVGFSSELRYGDTPFDRDTLTVAISQSGETSDTLAAVRAAREAGSRVLAITNIRGSTLAREADGVLFMRAGLEVCVAATKTYTSQVMNALLFAIHLGRVRGALSRARARQILRDALALPPKVQEVLGDDCAVLRCAKRFLRGYDYMYIGRRYNLPTAYEGALKMKEISYLHAEGYGAGEMKHGPLALVDRRMTVVAIAPQGRVLEKMVSNMQEIHARKGHLVAVTTRGHPIAIAEETFEIPPCEEMFSPLLAVVPLQLLAYHTAVGLGRDVDQPRNLAKSVTVE